jgi:hypothetical protein
VKDKPGLALEVVAMNQENRPGKGAKPHGNDRKTRLSEELRRNLLKRKAQAKQRSAQPKAPAAKRPKS